MTVKSCFSCLRGLDLLYDKISIDPEVTICTLYLVRDRKSCGAVCQYLMLIWGSKLLALNKHTGFLCNTLYCMTVYFSMFDVFFNCIVSRLIVIMLYCMCNSFSFPLRQLDRAVPALFSTILQVLKWHVGISHTCWENKLVNSFLSLCQNLPQNILERGKFLPQILRPSANTA